MSLVDASLPSPTRRTLFVSLCGKPNVGKSTLLNLILGCKVSIVSPKAQTTRNCIRGIITENDVQLILTDTPGIFDPKKPLEHLIVESAYEGVRDAQQICLLIGPSSNINAEVQQILEKFPDRERPIIAIINKIDLLSRQQILENTQYLSTIAGIGEIFMISAKSGLGVEPLKQYLMTQATEDVWYYDADTALTDKDDAFLTAEITREHIFNALHAELPYATHVVTELLQHIAPNLVEIQQTIYIQKEGQKAILLGTKGQKIKMIAQHATAAMTKLLGGKLVKLSLCIKVKSNWIDHWQN